jgi:hypothetical protein
MEEGGGYIPAGGCSHNQALLTSLSGVLLPFSLTPLVIPGDLPRQVDI